MTKSKLIKIFSFPVLLMVAVLSFVSYMAWKEYSMNNVLVEQSLAGNSTAIEILKKYEKPWKIDERIVYQALEGNVHAIEVLKLSSSKNDCP